MPNVVITIDGPAGSGKSTAARKLAKRLGFVHLNSGALFRALGVEAKSRAMSRDNDEELCKIARELEFRFEVVDDGSTVLLVNGSDWGERLLSEEAGELASQVAVLPGVRTVFEEVQRSVGEYSSLVVEGRDAGTVVFPHATFKFYLDALPEIRAKRRFLQLKASSQSEPPVSLEQIHAEMEQRDRRDSTREIAPQKPADDAMVLDTSHLGVEEVLEKLEKIVSTG